ncbi:hypothetical protein BS78_10G205600 [Paspalum vaginatum]|nr:hypothetical protein BS78_10G205600 [Paspalum vaginatum]
MGADETKEANTSQEGDDLRANVVAVVSSLVTTTTGEEDQPAAAEETGKEACASEAGDRGLKRKEQAGASEGFDILRKKKVMLDLLAVWRSGLAEDEEEVRPAEAVRKKRTKVVKQRLPKVVIELMKQRAPVPTEIPEQHCGYYAWRSAQLVYEKALIDQYNDQGHAEDETEVTDDEEEMVEK